MSFRIRTVDNIFHRQLVVMSDKSIFGGGEGLGRGHGGQAAASRGAEVVGGRQPYPVLSYVFDCFANDSIRKTIEAIDRS